LILLATGSLRTTQRKENNYKEIKRDERKKDRKNNKNCLGSFQVLWNKNCTTENEEIMMKKLKSKETNKIRCKS
jgi:hypothetical protein